MKIIEILIVLFALAIAVGVPIRILLSTLGSIALIGFAVDRLFLLFGGKRG